MLPLSGDLPMAPGEKDQAVKMFSIGPFGLLAAFAGSSSSSEIQPSGTGGNMAINGSGMFVIDMQAARSESSMAP